MRNITIQGEGGKPWAYTSDIVAVGIVAAWIAGKATKQFEVPDVLLGYVLKWVFDQGSAVFQTFKK